MADQHDKETDPITSGNRMTKDEIAGRDPQDNTEVPEKSKDEKQEADQSSEEASSEEAPDLSHASDEDGDVEPSDEENQQG